jgi:hypothetical protein
MLRSAAVVALLSRVLVAQCGAVVNAAAEAIMQNSRVKSLMADR